MAIQINAKPLASFDRPVEMLMDCHRRIEHFLAVLQQVAQRYAGKPLDDDGRRAVQAAQEYFRHAAPRHTADEEESLFPRLLQTPAADPETLRVMQELEHDHRQAEQLHDQVDERFVRWMAVGASLDADVAAALAADLQRLRELYQRHIAVEEQRLFPAASAALSSDQMRLVGQEMRRRRS